MHIPKTELERERVTYIFAAAEKCALEVSVAEIYLSANMQWISYMIWVVSGPVYNSVRFHLTPVK